MTLLETLGEKGLKDFNEMLKNTQIADIPEDKPVADNVNMEEESKTSKDNQKMKYYKMSK